MKNKKRKEKEPKFYIPLPEFTKEQGKYVYAISAVIIAFLIGVIGFLMYAMSNPEILTTTRRTEPTTVSDTFSSTKEYTTTQQKQYTGGIYVPTEAPEPTSPTVTHNADRVITGEEETKPVLARPTQTEKNTTTTPSTTTPTKETTTAETTTEEETTAEETTAGEIEEGVTEIAKDVD